MSWLKRLPEVNEFTVCALRHAGEPDTVRVIRWGRLAPGTTPSDGGVVMLEAVFGHTRRVLAQWRYESSSEGDGYREIAEELIEVLEAHPGWWRELVAEAVESVKNHYRNCIESDAQKLAELESEDVHV